MAMDIAARLESVRSAGYAYAPTLVDVGHGESLSVVDAGSGHPVVFSHGTPTWSYDWRRLIEHLSPQFRCVAPDHLGFGLSPRPTDADYGPEAHANRFGRLIDRYGFERYSLVVHDFGGPFALYRALDQPERIAALVVINSFAWPFSTMGRKTAFQASIAGSALFRWLYRRVNLSFVIADSAWGNGATKDPKVWAMHRSLFSSAGDRGRVLFALAESLAQDQMFFARLDQRLDRLRHTPVHLIWGMRDSAFPPAFLSRFQQAWPQASVLSLPDAGHWPHEEQPEVCAQSIETFLRASAGKEG